MASPVALLRAERRRQAFSLRLAGVAYEDIGNKLGISKQSAHSLVKRTLDESRERLHEDVESIRKIELRRTEALFMSLWPNRMQPRVADTLLRVLERRARLLGLDAPTRIDGTMQGFVKIEVATGIEAAPGSRLPAPLALVEAE